LTPLGQLLRALAADPDFFDHPGRNHIHQMRRETGGPATSGLPRQTANSHILAEWRSGGVQTPPPIPTNDPSNHTPRNEDNQPHGERDERHQRAHARAHHSPSRQNRRISLVQQLVVALIDCEKRRRARAVLIFFRRPSERKSFGVRLRPTFSTSVGVGRRISGCQDPDSSSRVSHRGSIWL
jgi:hypothetical protein